MSLEQFRAEFASALIGEGETLRFQPRDADEAARGMRSASRYGLSVALDPKGAQIVLDLSKFSGVLELDEGSRLIHLGAGTTLAEAESILRERSMTLALPLDEASGSLPLYRALLAKLPGGVSPDDDPVRQLVVGLEALLADGRQLSIRPAPRRAVGPDFTLGILKSGGELGFPLSFWLAYRAYAARDTLAFRFPSAEKAEIALAQIRGRGVRPLMARVDGEQLELELEEGPLHGAMQAIALQIAEKYEGRRAVKESLNAISELEETPDSPSLAPLFASIRGRRS